MADPHINLTGDASSLVAAVNQATIAISGFDQATAKLVKDQARVGAGDVLTRTLTQIDTAGNKVITTFKKLDGVITQTSATTANAVGSIKQYAVSTEAAASAQALFAQASALNATGLQAGADAFRAEAAAAIQDSIALRKAAEGHAETAAAQTNAGAAAAAQLAATTKLTKALQLQADAGRASANATREQAAADIAAAEAAFLRKQAIATEAGGRLQTSVADTPQRGQEEVIRQERRAHQERLKNLKTQAVEDQKLFKQRDALAAKSALTQQAASDKEAQAAITSAFNQIAAAQNTELAKREANQRALAGLRSELLKEEAATSESARKQAAVFQDSAEKRHAGNERVLSALKVELAREEQAVFASSKKQAAAFQANAEKRQADHEKTLNALKIELAREEQATFASAKKQAAAYAQLQLERRRALQSETLQTRRPGTDFRTIGEGGKASTAQVQSFLTAERSVQRLVATNEVSFKETSAAIAEASSGTLQLAQANTVARQEALKLVAAEKQVAIGAKQAAKASKGLTDSVKSLGKLIGISLLIGGAFRLVTGLTEAAQAAGELSIKIAEIETITKDAAFSTEQWADGLRTLSNEFGIDTLKQAEAAYQVLSSQIVNANDAAIQGAEVIKFLGVANKLAITGVTDTANATNLLTAALNSFKIPAEQAELVAAKLFKSVELGRFRIEELAQGFGRVGVPAKQLGIELSELLGVQAQITNQGVKLNEANTLIRGIILKLIKPTEELKKVFRDLGVTNAETLIAARGLPGALQAIEAATDGTTTEVAKLFSRVRAITGALSVFGDNAEDTANKISEIRETTIESFGKDTQNVIKTAGQQLKIAGQEAQNFFERAIGTPAVKAIADWIKEAGGMTMVIQDVITNLKTFGKVLAIAFAVQQIAAIKATESALFLLGRQFGKATLAVRAFTLAILANPALAAAAAITAALTAGSEALLRSSREALRAAEAANLGVIAANDRRNTAIEAANAIATQNFEREIDKRLSTSVRFFTDLTGLEFKNADRLEQQGKQVTERFKILLKDFKKSVTEQVSVAKKELKGFGKAAEDAAKLTQKILSGESKTQFDIDFQSAGAGTQVALVENEVIASRARIAKAVAAGDLKLFEIERKRLNELTDQRIEAEVKVATETSKIQQQLVEARADRLRATTREQRLAADDRINDLNRQARLLQNGSAAQLKQERDLQKIRQQAENARDADSFAAALDELAKLKREQERINNLAIAERRIRARSATEAAKQAAQAEEIRKTNEKRAELARIEALRVRQLQVAFNLVAKDAEKFKSERVTEGKTAEEINKAVAEQQARFAKLITLGREISGTNRGDALFLNQDKQLREQANTQQRILNAAENAKQLDALKEQLKERLAAAKAVSEVESNNLETRQRELQKVADQLERTFSGQLRGRKIQRATGAFNQPNDDGDQQNRRFAVSSFETLIRQGRELNTLITQQGANFTDERQSDISRLTASLLSSPLLDEERLSAKASRLNTRGERFEGVVQAIRELQTFRANIKNAGEGALIFKKSQETVETFFKGLESLGESPREEKAREKELTARQKATKALEESLEIRTKLNKILRGESILEGTKVQTPVQPASLEDAVGSVDVAIEEGVEKTVAKQFKDGAAKGTEEGLRKAYRIVKPESQKTAEDIGKAQAQAKNKEELKTAPELLQQIARAEADLKKRQATIENRAPDKVSRKETEFTAPKVDTTIRLGRGAPSIASQQLRIEKELAKVEAERAKVRAAEREQKKKDAAIARSSGARAGQFRGGLRPGQFKGGLRPGQFKDAVPGGEGPTQKKQLTAGEQTAANTKIIADATKAKEVVKTEARSPSPSTSEKPAVGESAAIPKDDFLGRGQDVAAAELRRVTGRDAIEQNRLLRAQEALAIEDQLLAGQSQYREAVLFSAQTEEERARINALRIPLLQTTLEAEQRAVAALQEAEKKPKPLDQIGGTPRDKFGDALRNTKIARTRVDANSGLRASITASSSDGNIELAPIINVEVSMDGKDVGNIVTTIVDKNLDRRSRQGISRSRKN